MKDNIKTSLSIILVTSLSFRSLSQADTIYFSTTGDTVLYSSVFYHQIDSILGSYTTCVKSLQDKKVKELSTFNIVTEPANNPWKGLSKDTIRKYNLKYDGKRIYPYAQKDFSISVKPTNIELIDTAKFGAKFIYKTRVYILVTCKGQILYSNNFNFLFHGNSPKDFPERDIVRIDAWQKQKTKKYFIDLSIREYEVIVMPNKRPDYFFKNYLFIL